MEIRDIFKDEAKEEEDGVIDLIIIVVQLLQRDINGLVKIALGELGLVKPWDKG